MDWMSVSAVVAALSFTVLVIYLVKTLKTVQLTLIELTSTLQKTEHHLGELTQETKELVATSQQLVEDLNDKSKRLNHLVDAVDDVGITLHSFSKNVRKLSTEVVETATIAVPKVQNAFKVAETLNKLWNQFKK
ncbi:MAG: DUF948 domain-containing protein [Bacilli bacterium]